MDSWALKITAIFLLLIGETASIIIEVSLARRYSLTQPFLGLFLKGFLVMILAGAFLVTGYMLGFRSFKNIWIVSVISLATILITEPIIDYLIFRQLPTTGALIGLVLAVAGFAFAVFYK